MDCPNALFGIGLSCTFVSIYAISNYYCFATKEDDSLKLGNKSYEDLIGNTPLIELKKLHALLGRHLFVKMENLNPGGSGKDRAAKYMISNAKRHCRYHKGCSIVEGTSGSTGIALAGLCNQLGLALHIVMPDDQSQEKKRILQMFGASVTTVPTCSIANSNHYVNTARRHADQINGIFIDQFENTANYLAHFETTGPEIWEQTSGNIDAFVMSSGTGGTIAGVSNFLKSKNNAVKIVLADPVGSSLHNKVKHGVCYSSEQAERAQRRHRYDSIVEGVGLDRVTANFAQAQIDDSGQATDQECVDMAHWLLQEEGVFVGSSTALNLVVACKLARTMPKDSNVVTVVCDSGQRHLSRFWNADYLPQYNLHWPAPGVLPACLQPPDLMT